MQDNINTRLELQRAVGPLTTYVEGKSVAELRREKRKKRRISHHKANYHLPNTGTSIITHSMKGEGKNVRWYNNNLGKDSDELSTPITRQ